MCVILQKEEQGLKESVCIVLTCVCIHVHMYVLSFRTQWKKCTFSGDGEFIVAGSVPTYCCHYTCMVGCTGVYSTVLHTGSHRQHALYIWDKATGSLVKMLTGHKGETLLDIVVSYTAILSIICSTCMV